MKHIFRRFVSLLLSAAMFFSLSAHAAPAAENPPPSQVTRCESNAWPESIRLGFPDHAAGWLKKLTGVRVNDTDFDHQPLSISSRGNQWNVQSVTGAYGSYPALCISTQGVRFPATVVISAEGSPDLTINITKTGGGLFPSYAAEIISAETTPPSSSADKDVTLQQIRITDDGGAFPAYHWQVSFADAPDYVSAITDVRVNGEVWEKKSAPPSAGGAYYPDTAENCLVFSIDRFSAAGPDTLKSGDVIQIAAAGYPDLEFKFMLDRNGKNPSAAQNDGQGDRYALHVKLIGAFEAAVVGQKDYDGISSATGTVSANKNSDVTVYGALVEKGKTPAADDWSELNEHASSIQLAGNLCSVAITPDAAKGTPPDKDSGMQGVYQTISSALTLSGTPQDAGSYLVSITVTDKQGRTATSNTLPFRIYAGEETLADQLRTATLKQTQDGKSMWDIMEPWVIQRFGSNVDGKSDSVRVPQGLKAWFGSHTSGTYGYLGYDLAWQDVMTGEIPQTLFIPNGCDLTLVNMQILSSVRIVIESGGKLTLRDSVVQGIIDVASGGTFSMNYSGYGSKGKFLTGASICGQLRLQDGAILENAAIYSNTNYLANGKLADRVNSEPVVTATGNVTVRGQVFIRGDETGDGQQAQTGLRVQDGVLTVADGATLVVYGGNAKLQPAPVSGTAIQLENGTVTGGGKLAAIAGQTFLGDGGNAVSGSGAISTTQTFLQGATAFSAMAAKAGKAIAGQIPVTSPQAHIADGSIAPITAADPLEGLYWKSSIDPTPPLHAFHTSETKTVPAPVLSITADRDTLYGGGAVTLTVRHATGSLSVRQTDDQGSAEQLLRDGTGDIYTVNLPNHTATYTFTATAENGVAQCTVAVLQASRSRSRPRRSTLTTSSAVKNPDGSTTTTVSHPQTGTITETTAWTNGANRVIERSKNGNVITTETRADRVEIRTTASPGQNTLATVTLPAHVDSATVTIPVPAGKTTVAKDKVTGQIIRICTSTEQGISIHLTRSTELVIMDNTKTFSDIAGHWAKDAIDFVAAREVFSGTGTDAFSPDGLMQRSMLVTVLARFDGQNTTGGRTWYTKPMEWAQENGISDGSDPGSPVTREQLASMLHRYAAYRGFDTKYHDAVIQTFSDDHDIAHYARPSLTWAVQTGLIQGTGDHTISPKAHATRAQVAQILMRFCQTLCV